MSDPIVTISCNIIIVQHYSFDVATFNLGICNPLLASEF